MSTDARGLRLSVLVVRRFGEDQAAPIVLDDRKATCGSASDCIRRGCIGLDISGRGGSRLVHLTSDEALRLSDLLRAMHDSNECDA